ncbi:hypothetical protein GCM10010428_71760 [Actinosynnema pretiosum subsp. pretiosum]
MRGNALDAAGNTPGVTRVGNGARKPEPPGGPGCADRDDRVLWELAGAGDRGAFGELYRRHVEAVWNYAYRLTGSWSVAEDLTSATFLAAWRKLADLTLVNASARPWLFTVTSNLAMHEHRSGAVQPPALARPAGGGHPRPRRRRGGPGGRGPQAAGGAGRRGRAPAR